jgi:hypothetical protein
MKTPANKLASLVKATAETAGTMPNLASKFQRILLHPVQNIAYKQVAPSRDSPARWSEIKLPSGERYEIGWTEPNHDPGRLALNSVLYETGELTLKPFALDIYQTGAKPAGVLWLPHPSEKNKVIAAHCQSIRAIKRGMKSHVPVLLIPAPKTRTLSGCPVTMDKSIEGDVMEDVINALAPEAGELRARKAERKATGLKGVAKSIETRTAQKGGKAADYRQALVDCYNRQVRKDVTEAANNIRRRYKGAAKFSMRQLHRILTETIKKT